MNVDQLTTKRDPREVLEGRESTHNLEEECLKCSLPKPWSDCLNQTHAFHASTASSILIN